MPELGILLTRAEERLLIELVLSKRGFLVPDIHYSSRKHAIVRSIRDFLRYRQATTFFFILRDDYIVAPLEIRQMAQGGTLVYYVMQRNGGPSIDFLSSAEHTTKGAAKVTPGFVAHHPTFWNPTTCRNEKPPLSMVRLFAEIRSFIRSIAITVKLGKRSYLVGKEMIVALNTGAKILGIDGVPWSPPQRSQVNK